MLRRLEAKTEENRIKFLDGFGSFAARHEACFQLGQKGVIIVEEESSEGRSQVEAEGLQSEAEEENGPQAEEEALQTEAEKREQSRGEALLLEAEVVAANLKESGTRR